MERSIFVNVTSTEPAPAGTRNGSPGELLPNPIILLGIETSCDETAAAVVDEERTIRSSVVRSQLTEHAPFGGVVPELAARAHLAHLNPIIRQALAEADMPLDRLDGIAAAGGPGLIGGLIVGTTSAKAMAFALDRPFVAVNHLEAHALTARLTHDLDFPYLLLLVSGGHCQLLIVEGVGRYRRLGTTIDDAAGEAFDKTATLLGLGFPGGPAIERLAAEGDAAAVRLPRPLAGRAGCDFSFSGLKTAVKRWIDARPAGPLPRQSVADAAASLQAAVGDCLIDRTANALARFRASHPQGGALVAAGGVAANHSLRRRLSDLANRTGVSFVAPPLALCTDNGAMIAWAGIERLRLGWSDGLDFAPRPRWPLDPAAAPAVGAGVKA